MRTVPQGQWYRGGVHVFYEGSWHVQLNFGVVGVSVSERVPEEYLTYCCSIQQYPGKTCYTLDYTLRIGEDASKKGLFTSFTFFLCKQQQNRVQATKHKVPTNCGH